MLVSLPAASRFQFLAGKTTFTQSPSIAIVDTGSPLSLATFNELRRRFPKVVPVAIVDAGAQYGNWAHVVIRSCLLRDIFKVLNGIADSELSDARVTQEPTGARSAVATEPRSALSDAAFVHGNESVPERLKALIVDDSRAVREQLKAGLNGGGIALSEPYRAASGPILSTTTGSPLPTRLSVNIASNRGGAVFAENVPIYLDAARIDGNFAADGSAVYVAGSGFYSNSRFELGCVKLSYCSLVDGNTTTMDPGSTITVEGGLVQIDRAMIRNNSAGSILHTGDRTTITDSVIVRNEGKSNLPFRLYAYMSVSGSTIADNPVPNPSGGGIFNFEAAMPSFYLDRSIVMAADASQSLVSPTNAVTNFYWDVFNSIDLQGKAGSIVVASARFVDPLHNDYHLQAGSQAVDFAPLQQPIVGSDFEGRDRNVQLAKPDTFVPPMLEHMNLDRSAI